eukprot:45522-Eustigmatos_ZCMA.PRE.1
MIAAMRGSADVVAELLHMRGVEVNAVDCDGYTALMLAAQTGHPRVVEAMIAGVKSPTSLLTMVNKVCQYGDTALAYAVGKG